LHTTDMRGGEFCTQQNWGGGVCHHRSGEVIVLRGRRRWDGSTAQQGRRELGSLMA
jgi:hypothetical protein